MADKYYDAQAVGANNGTSKADAYTSFLVAINANTAADTLWVSHTSSQIAAGSITGFFAGRVICVDFSGSDPPVPADYTTGAFVHATGSSSDITLRCNFDAYVEGISFKADDDIEFEGGVMLYRNCAFQVVGAGDLMNVQFGGLHTFIDCDFSLLTASNQFSLKTGDLRMYGGSITGNPNWIVGLLQNNSSFYMFGVDLSGISSTIISGNVASSSLVDIVVGGCLLNAGLTFGSIIRPGTQVRNYGSSDTNKPYYIQEDSYYGTMQSETTIIKTGGASDGVTPISLKFITNANAVLGYFGVSNKIPVLFWAETIGNNTFEVDLISDGLVLTEEDVSLELCHPQAGVQRAFISSLDISGANLPASTAVWTTTGLSAPNKQKVSLTVNVGQKGWIEAILFVTRPSIEVYADLKILDGARQYLAGVGYINGPALACDNPIEDKVAFGTVYDFGAKVGNRTDAPEDKVENLFQYGAGGVEFTGSLLKTLYQLPQEVILEDDEIIIFEGCD